MKPLKMQKIKKQEEEKLHRIPLRITDTTLRDAHQSLWATRLRTDDILPIIDVIDSVGYYSLECWGGATFDVCLRFLRENPWERLRKIKAHAKNTPLQMLLRGQNLVGYRNYADDLVDRFVALSRENGIDIFRVFDALNDTRNLEVAVKAVKKYNGHAQGTLSYTISPVHSVEKFVQYAKEQVDVGIDSICIKDMAGILSPIGAEQLITALVSAVKVPIQVHCHASSGMATATYVESVRAGAGAIDCAISSMAGFSSQPPVETLAAIFAETHYAPGLDMEALEKVAKYFSDLAPKRRQSNELMPIIDPGILVHQIPGGMISNFRSQLSQQKALDKLPLALKEVSKVREDLGWPPLVTPTSQIVGTQAAMNVLAGERYKMVPNEVKDYVRGKYGRSPAPISAEMIKKILGDEKPISGRPADSLKPELPKATENIDAKLIEHEEDIISYCILPEPSLEYFKWRALPVDQRPKTPADIEVEKQQGTVAKPAVAAAAPIVTTSSKTGKGSDLILSNDDFKGFSEILGKMQGVALNEFTIRKGDFVLTLRSGVGSGSAATTEPVLAVTAIPAAQVTVTPESQPEPKPQPEASATAASEPVAATASADYSRTISAPIGGTFYLSSGPGKPALVKEGDVVKAGDKVCIVEAMKLFNEITAPVDCKIVKLLVQSGQAVEKDQPLIGIKEM